MTGGGHLQEIAFDLYERYILLEQIGELFRPGNSPYQVLDVGGHTPALWPGFSSLAGALIPDACVAVVDTLPGGGLRNYVRASGVRLPFRDGAFDLVCSLDTLEHVPGEQRPAFLAELLRVSRDGLYLAFPFDSASNRWAESVVREYANVVLKDPIPALQEHHQFGLPGREAVTSLFSGMPFSWIGFEQGNTDVWLLMMLTYHSLRAPGTDFVRELNRRFNQAYAAQDWTAPHYRAGYLVSKHRSIADLEAARATFGAAGKQAGLESVLALCQLFLTIAQNTRVTVDKDRHIANLERELAAARTPMDRPLEYSESPPGGLEFQARLEARMRALELGLVTNRRAIQAIYESRIWRALSRAGGWLLRLTGHRAAPDHGTAWARTERAAGAAARAHRDANDELLTLTCDYPDDGSALPARDIVEIRGWALAGSGIDRVLIQIGDGPPAAASYGIPRPDVARTYPETPGSGHSGYRFFWDTTGLPDGPCTVRITAVARSGRREQAVLHVSLDAKTLTDYACWIERHEPTAEALEQMRRQAAQLTDRPRISIAVPIYKPPIRLVTRSIDSVLAQTYPEWELCLVDDGSRDAALATVLQKYLQSDARIRLATLERNCGISAATNQALRLAAGEYVAFLDHDDELAPFALSEVVQAIHDHPDTDLFYSDEDKIDEQDRRYDPFFKPDWSPDLFRSCNYACHFVVMRRSLLDRLGGLDESYSGSQDYELLLRAIEHTQKIRRIPKVLYHWRAVAGSAAKGPDEKPAASADGRRALAAYLVRNAPGAQVEEVGLCRYRVRYPISSGPRVSILIPSCTAKNVFRAVEAVLEKTAYKNYEIVLIDNSGAARIEEFAVRQAARQAPVRHFDWRGRPFNFAAMNNAAVQAVTSPYVLFLNDDTTVITAEWLSAMLEHAQRPEVGAVGAQLWYPNGMIQHAGVVMGIYDNCSHAFKGLPAGMRHYFDLPSVIRNCSAVTGACMLVSRAKFFEAGTFDEVNLAVAFQDVDLCLKLLELGYRNVYTPYARLYHYESASKTEKDKIPDAGEDAFMKRKWAKYIADDPYYNPNLARRKEDFSLAID